MRSNMLMMLGCLLLVACGFQPLYGDGAGKASAPILAQIEIKSIPERSGQFLRQEIIDRLQPQGVSAQPLYALEIKVREDKGDQTIAKNATVTRSYIRQTVNYALTDKRTHKVILRRELIATNSYNNLFSEFGTIVTENDARSRSLQEIAERLSQQLSVYFAHPMKQDAESLKEKRYRSDQEKRSNLPYEK